MSLERTQMGSKRGDRISRFPGSGFGFEVPAQVLVVRTELTINDPLDERLGNTQEPSKGALGNEVHARAAIDRVKHPRAVDRLRSLHDVRVQAPGPLELRELDYLFELRTARNLCPLAEAVSLSWWSLGEHLDACL